jgi:hypothetical protein
MSPFAQYLRNAQILILEILNVFLWLKFLPSLILDKIEHFETASTKIILRRKYHEKIKFFRP